MPQEKYFSQLHNFLEKYKPISEEAFSQLIPLLKIRRVQKNEFLLQVNQVARKMYFVCDGLLISIFSTPDGSTHIKNFFLENHFAASTVSLLLSSPSAFSIQALEDGVILEFDFKKYKQLILHHDDFKLFYIDYLEKNWIIKNEKRQLAFATQTAKERYLTFLKEYPDLEKRVPQLHIASYLGVTPTQLSRIRKDL